MVSGLDEVEAEVEGGAKVSCGFQVRVEAAEVVRERELESLEEERREERIEAREKEGRRAGKAE